MLHAALTPSLTSVHCRVEGVHCRAEAPLAGHTSNLHGLGPRTSGAAACDNCKAWLA